MYISPVLPSFLPFTLHILYEWEHFCFFLCFCGGAGIKLGALGMLDRCSVTKLHIQPMNAVHFNTQLCLFPPRPSLEHITMSRIGDLNPYPLTWQQWSYPPRHLSGLFSSLFSQLSLVLITNKMSLEGWYFKVSLACVQELEFLEKVTVFPLENLMVHICSLFCSAEVDDKMMYMNCLYP